jgi:predicted permease
VFYVCAPALVLQSVPLVPLNSQTMLLPAIAALVVLACFACMQTLASFLRLEPSARGVTVVGCSIMNLGFLFPFIFKIYGDEGFGYLMLADLGNALLCFSFVYALAFHYGSGGSSIRTSLKKVLYATRD